MDPVKYFEFELAQISHHTIQDLVGILSNYVNELNQQ